MSRRSARSILTGTLVSTLCSLHASRLDCVGYSRGFSNGTWVDTLDAPPAERRGLFGQRGAPVKLANATHGGVRWQWRPHDPRCALKRASLRGFCASFAALNVSRVLLVGDSVQLYLYKSLVQLLETTARRDDGTVTAAGGHKGSFHASVIKCAAPAAARVDLMYARADTMAVGEATYEPGPSALRHDGAWTSKKLRRAERGGGAGRAKAPPPRAPTVSFDWVDVLAASELAVVNWGAHYHNAKSYLRERDELAARLDGARERARPNATVLWRTTASGHPNCTAAPAAPLSQREYDTLWERAVEVGDRSVVDFTWNLFGEFDELGRELWTPDGGGGAPWPRVVPFDVEPLTRHRADLHALDELGKRLPSKAAAAARCAREQGRACALHGADCLHWSGPWMGFHLAQLMFNILDAMGAVS